MLQTIKHILSTSKSKAERFVVYCLAPIHRIGLTNTNFTIISNNCWGGRIYQRFNLPYRTSFLGLFIPAPCYIKLLENFEYNLSLPLQFIPISQSKYYHRIVKSGRQYPIGLLGTDIEIHFLHYKTPQEAQEKWQRRKERINISNMLVKFAEMDCCTPDLIRRFDKLPFKHKICFAVNTYPELKSVHAYPHNKTDTEVKDDYKYVPYDLKNILNHLNEN